MINWIIVYSMLGFNENAIPFGEDYQFFNQSNYLNRVDIHKKIVTSINYNEKILESYYITRYPDLEFDAVSFWLLDELKSRDMANGYERMVYDADNDNDFKIIVGMVNQKKKKFDLKELVIDLG